MRIISGYLGGRTIESPSGHLTHPMSEKIRGAIFNMLGDIKGLTLFDAFSGSGALAFEAVSRGVKSALLTDLSKQACIAITRNIKNLNIEDKTKIVRANASGWSDNNPEVSFDIVIADPPYDDPQTNLLKKLSKHVKPNGLYILSLPPNVEIDFKNFDNISEKNYGEAKLYIYRKVLS